LFVLLGGVLYLFFICVFGFLSSWVLKFHFFSLFFVLIFPLSCFRNRFIGRDTGLLRLHVSTKRKTTTMSSGGSFRERWWWRDRGSVAAVVWRGREENSFWL